MFICLLVAFVVLSYYSVLKARLFLPTLTRILPASHFLNTITLVLLMFIFIPYCSQKCMYSTHPSILLVCLLPLLGHQHAMACLQCRPSFISSMLSNASFNSFCAQILNRRGDSGHPCLVPLSVYSAAKSLGFSCRQFNNSEDSSSIPSASLSLSSSNALEVSPLLKVLVQHRRCIVRDRLASNSVGFHSLSSGSESYETYKTRLTSDCYNVILFLVYQCSLQHLTSFTLFFCEDYNELRTQQQQPR